MEGLTIIDQDGNPIIHLGPNAIVGEPELTMTAPGASRPTVHLQAGSFNATLDLGKRFTGESHISLSQSPDFSNINVSGDGLGGEGGSINMNSLHNIQIQSGEYEVFLGRVLDAVILTLEGDRTNIMLGDENIIGLSTFPSGQNQITMSDRNGVRVLLLGPDSFGDEAINLRDNRGDTIWSAP